MIPPETEVSVLGPDGTELLNTVLPPGEYVIGRTEDCHLQVTAGLVSRKHARLIIEDDGVRVEDLGSSNGTFVNGQQVTDSRRLFPNQRIQVGDATISIRRKKMSGDSLPPPNAAAVRRLLPEELLRDRKYDIGREVAKGGMGSILSAQESAIRREVAMKVMRHRPGEEDLLRFVEEAQITGQLEHPNIVPVHELGVDENEQLFYTMKMVRGITLKKVLELLAQGVQGTIDKYPLPVLLTIFQKVCDGISFAHAKGVIHRDLKPENIMLGGYGEVLVMDWGLAKVINTAVKTDGSTDTVKTVVSSARYDDDIGVTMVGTVMGTPQFMSPEQARGEVETLDVRSDIYSLGALLYNILALRPSVTGKKPIEIVEKVARGEISPLTQPRTRSGPLSEGLVAVVQKAMALDREQRYANVHALQEDLAAYQGGYATSAEKVTVVKQIKLLIARNKKAAGVAAGAVGLIAVLSTVFVVNVVRERNRADAQRVRAINGEKQAAQSLAMANTALLRVKIEKAREAFDNNRADEGLAWLAAVLRQDPQNRFASSWILSALSDRNFPIPSAPRLVIDKIGGGPEGNSTFRYSPDGQRFFFCPGYQRYAVYDSTTGKQLWSRNATTSRIHFAPDGHSVAICESGAEDKKVRFLDVDTGKDKGVLVHTSSVRTFLFSPDGTIIATADSAKSGSIRIWNSRNQEQTMEPLTAPGDVVQFAISGDNHWLAARTQTNNVYVFDLRSREMLAVLPTKGDYAGYPSFHPITGQLLIPHGPGANRPWLYEPGTGKILQGNDRHGGGQPLIEGSFSPDGLRIATGGPDYKARLWDTRTGAMLPQELTAGGVVAAPLFSTEGLRILTSSADGVARLWDVRNGTLLAEPFRMPEAPFQAAQTRFSPDGIHVATAARKRSVQFWDVRDGRQFPTLMRHPGSIMAMMVSPDGKLVATSADSGGSITVRLWDAVSGEQVCPELKHEKGVRSVSFSPDSTRIATACYDNSVRVFDVKTGNMILGPLTHEGMANAVAFSADGRFLASSATDKTTRIWDATTGKPVGEPLKGNTNPMAVGFSPNGKFLVTVTDGGTYLDDVASRRRIFEFSGSRHYDARFSPDSTRLAVATESDGVRIVDTASGQDVASIPIPVAVRSARFSPDGKRLVTAAVDGTARVWDVSTGQPVTLALQSIDPLNVAVFSADGERIATGTSKGAVRLWDAVAGQPLSELMRHNDEIRNVEFTADGQRLAVATMNWVCTVWDVPPPPKEVAPWLPALAEAVAGRRIDAMGELTATGENDYWYLHQHLMQANGTDYYSRWATWFYADRGTRTATPWTTTTLPDAIDKALALDLDWVREQIIRRSPSNFGAVSRQARSVFTRSKTTPPLEREAELLAVTANRIRFDLDIAAKKAAGVEAYTVNAGVRGLPARDPNATVRELDLTWHYTALCDVPWTSDDAKFSLANMPKGLQTFDGVRFDVRGLIIGFNEKLPLHKPQPMRVDGIPVGQKIQRLHALHAYAYQATDGQKVASYVLHYADGETRELPLIAGEDSRNWNYKSEQKLASKAHEAWRSDSESGIRLFHRAYDNPRPDVEVTQIDFVSGRTDAAAMVAGLSVE